MKEILQLSWEQLSELIHWADLTDTASYKDAQEAVTLEAPALQLMSVLEFMPDGDLAQTVIEGLSGGALMDVANMPEIQNRFEPILAQQQAAVQLCCSALLRAAAKPKAECEDAPHARSHRCEQGSGLTLASCHLAESYAARSATIPPACLCGVG